MPAAQRSPRSGSRARAGPPHGRELRFFDHWLKGVDNCVMAEPPVHYYTYNAQPGEQWQSAESWPLPGEQRTEYHLADGLLTTAEPAAGAQPDTFQVRYDVTAANRTQTGLVYATEPLAAPVRVTGHPVVDLRLVVNFADAATPRVQPAPTVTIHRDAARPSSITLPIIE